MSTENFTLRPISADGFDTPTGEPAKLPVSETGVPLLDVVRQSPEGSIYLTIPAINFLRMDFEPIPSETSLNNERILRIDYRPYSSYTLLNYKIIRMPDSKIISEGNKIPYSTRPREINFIDDLGVGSYRVELSFEDTSEWWATMNPGFVHSVEISLSTLEPEPEPEPIGEHTIFSLNPTSGINIRGELIEGSPNISIKGNGDFTIPGRVEYLETNPFIYSESTQVFSGGVNNNVSVSQSGELELQRGNNLEFSESVGQFSSGDLINVTPTTPGGGLKLIERITYSTIIEDFSDTSYEFVFSGNWGRTSGGYNDGYAWANPANSSGSTEFTVTIGQSTTFSYWTRVIANNKSSLSFAIIQDGRTVQSDNMSGSNSTNPSWTQKSFNISAGTYTMRWSYSNGSGKSYGNQQAFIDNISIGGIAITQYEQIGYRVSPPIPLSGISGNSIIQWSGNNLTQQNVIIEVSLDKNNWSPVSNGSQIPIITSGMNLDGKSLYLKQTLISSDPNNSPELTNIEGTVFGIYTQSGSRLIQIPIDPKMESIGINSITWNTQEPTDTSVKFSLSLDNINWTAIESQGEIPVLNIGGQPPANIFLREELSTNNISVTPSVLDVKITISQTVRKIIFSLDGTNLTVLGLEQGVLFDS
jgi:hypothetical protein